MTVEIITEYLDPDLEYGEMETQCLGIPGRRKQDSTSNTETKNNSAPEKPFSIISYENHKHTNLTAGRAGSHKSDPRYQGVGFQVLNRFSGLGHQNSLPLHK